MGKMSADKKKRKNTLQDQSPAAQIPLGFEKIPGLILSIQEPFLKDRVSAYVKHAQILLQELRLHPSASHTSLAAKFKQFGKNARILDLILAISGTSGYLSPQSKATAQKIRLSIEQQIEPFTQRQTDGVLVLTTASGSLRAETHSSMGRRIARLFARVVPPSEVDKAPSPTLRASFLPEATDQKIKELLKKADALCHTGQVPQAEPLYKEVLAIDRKNPEAVRGLALLYLDQGHNVAALPLLEEALLFYPQDKVLINYLAEVLSQEDRLVDAITWRREALRLSPQNAMCLTKLGKALLLGGHDSEAQETLEKAVELAPQSAEALTNLGLFYHLTYQTEKAALYYVKALKISPKDSLVLTNLGIIRGQQHKNSEGLDFINRALTIDPRDQHALFMKSHLLLASGDYKDGWFFYEYGIGHKQWRDTPLLDEKSVWKGESDPNLRLLIRKEQGLGDALQFIRYAALCKQRVGKVYVLCPEPLVRLFEQCPYIDTVVTSLDSASYDAQILMLSLPHIFETTLQNVPADVPYLFVPPKVQKEWGSHFQTKTKELKIGLVWSGGAYIGRTRGDQHAKRRNINLEQLRPLLNLKNTTFYSLQMGLAADQIEELDLKDRVIDLMPKVKDMADTAALIENLDLVITVDTSIAHLAGGLGKPVWILSRYDACWRWLNNKPESPWYPTARVFGQPKTGQWESVISEVEDALLEQIETHVSAT